MKYCALVLILIVSACGSTSDDASAPSAAPTEESETESPAVETPDTPGARLDQISAEVDAWAASTTLREARAHAEAAANMIVGEGGLDYGDRNGDGDVDGAVEVGFLPGPEGSPGGLVLDTYGDAECVTADVLGGSWEDPVERWTLLDDVIIAWAPDNNPFPSLPSHPMRIVGWASLSQDASLETAIEYAGHAALHVDISRDGLAAC